MKPTLALALLALLAAPATARSEETPRVARPIPPQPTAKVDAQPDLVTDAPPRAVDPSAASGAAPGKRAGATDARTVASRRAVDRVYYRCERDGTVWASGRTYKASFGADGATYVPFLGSRAPRNFPLAMSLASATAGGVAIPLEPAAGAVRDADRVVIDRGAVDEVYELGLDGVEQTFVVSERPAAGDLSFVVRLETEMARGPEDADGFAFSNEHGSVRYGRAFVRESDGRRVPVASRATDGGVEIVVGADYLAGASFPLVVDPVISTFATDNGAGDTWSSEIAYDLSTDRYLTVYELNFSQSDGDVFAILREGNGSQSYFQYLDNTSENWRTPHVANLNDANQFFMVADAIGVPGVTNWNVWGMSIDAQTLATGWKTLISTTDQSGAKYMCDIGGDSYDGTGQSYYCVTWRRDFSITDCDIHARLVRPDSTLVGSGTILIDNSGSSKDSQPSISKSAGFGGNAAAWTIVWQREASGNYNVHGARISWDGIVLNPSAQLTSLSGIEHSASVSSPTLDNKTLVVYARQFASDDDIDYLLLNGTTVESSGSLTALDAPATILQDQIDFSIDSDGWRYVVAYSESYSGSTFDYDIWASSFANVGGVLECTEAHRSLDFSTAQAVRTDICAQRSGGASSPRFAVTWDSTLGGQHDVLGGLYDRPAGGGHVPFCFGDGTGFNCPCGNNGATGRGCANSQSPSGALLSAAGSSVSTGADSMSFTVAGVPANVTCTLFQGTSSNTVLFGDGVRCVAGTQIRIRSKFASASGSATWPTAGEPPVSVTGQVPFGGARRYYQVSYRNSAVYCTSATFNISNGMNVLWLP